MKENSSQQMTLEGLNGESLNEQVGKSRLSETLGKQEHRTWQFIAGRCSSSDNSEVLRRLQVTGDVGCNITKMLAELQDVGDRSTISAIRGKTQSGTRVELFRERSAKRGDTMRAFLFLIN
jgi:hypothetical protein